MFSFALFLIGFTALTSQIILLRELLIVFYGNEITLGLILGLWLLIAGAGSLFTGKILLKKTKNHLRLFSSIQILIAIYLPLSIYLVRILPRILNLFPGEIAGEIPVILSIIPLILPLNGLLGALFACGCEVYKKKPGIIPAGYTYMLESLGAFAGGMFTIFILLPNFDSFQSHIILSSLNFISVIFLNPLLLIKLISFLFIFTNILLFSRTPEFNKTLITKIYPGYTVRLFKNTHYQNLMVLEKEDSLSLYTSGIYNFTYPDPATSEMTAHMPLSQHENPKKILIIGGGLSGITKEILKHPVTRVIYLELDPMVIENLQGIFPPPDDERFKIIISDPRHWFKKNPDKFDIVILQLPPPHTILINRYYTQEFFAEVYTHLNDGGLISFSLPSQPNYLSHEQRMFFDSLKKTLCRVFPEVLITPGETAFFLAAKNKGTLTSDWRKMLGRLQNRRIKTQYFREYYLFSELSRSRFEDLQTQLKINVKTPVNRDFYPISYFYNTILWSSQFKCNFKGLFKKLNFANIFPVFLLLYLLLLYPVYTRKPAYKYRLVAVIALTGFAEISFQIITLLIFQIFYGSIFWKLSLIFTSFMLGLIFGSCWITRLMEKKLPEYRWLVNTQIAILLYPLVLPLTILLFKTYRPGELILLFLPFIPGFIGGIQFPLACGLYYLRQKSRCGEIGGLFYGFDLVGSFIGSIVLSLIIIPVLGIFPAIFMVFLLNISGLLLLSVR